MPIESHELTVGKLKELLSKRPDHEKVVCSSVDHIFNLRFEFAISNFYAVLMGDESAVLLDLEHVGLMTLEVPTVKI